MPKGAVAIPIANPPRAPMTANGTPRPNSGIATAAGLRGSGTLSAALRPRSKPIFPPSSPNVRVVSLTRRKKFFIGLLGSGVLTSRTTLFLLDPGVRTAIFFPDRRGAAPGGLMGLAGPVGAIAVIQNSFQCCEYLSRRIEKTKVNVNQTGNVRIAPAAFSQESKTLRCDHSIDFFL